jgi:hypothetical protein
MLLFLSRYRSSLGNRSCIAFPKSRNLRHGVHSPASSEATQLAKVTMSSIQFMRISDTSGGDADRTEATEQCSRPGQTSQLRPGSQRHPLLTSEVDTKLSDFKQKNASRVLAAPKYARSRAKSAGSGNRINSIVPWPAARKHKKKRGVTSHGHTALICALLSKRKTYRATGR